MALETGRDSFFDLLRGVNLVIAQRDVMVLAHQQIEDVDIVLPRLRPVDQKTRPGALAQRIIYVLGIVREHPERAVAAHDRIGPGKAFHQHCGNLQLARAGLPVATFTGQLVDVINRAEADYIRIQHIVDKGFCVLTRLTLIAVDIVGAQVLIAKRIACVLAIVVYQSRHHLDQRGLACARFAVTHEGENEAAKLGKGVQLPLKIIGHQHLRQLHRLILGDVVADDLIRFLERHCQSAGLRPMRRCEAVYHQAIRLDLPRRRLQWRQPPVVARTQRNFLHQRFAKRQNRGYEMRIIRRQTRDVLIQFPKRAMQSQLRVVSQNLIDLAHLDRHFGRLRSQQICRRIAKHVRHRQRLGAQQFREIRLLRTRQRAFQIGALQICQPGRFGKLIADRQSNRQRAAQSVHHRGLHRCDQRTVAHGLDPVNDLDTFLGRRTFGDQARCCRPKPPPRAHARGPFRRGLNRGFTNARRMIEAVQHAQSGRIMADNIALAKFHLI